MHIKLPKTAIAITLIALLTLASVTTLARSTVKTQEPVIRKPICGKIPVTDQQTINNINKAIVALKNSKKFSQSKIQIQKLSTEIQKLESNPEYKRVSDKLQSIVQNLNKHLKDNYSRYSDQTNKSQEVDIDFNVEGNPKVTSQLIEDNLQIVIFNKPRVNLKGSKILPETKRLVLELFTFVTSQESAKASKVSDQIFNNTLSVYKEKQKVDPKDIMTFNVGVMEKDNEDAKKPCIPKSAKSPIKKTTIAKKPKSKPAKSDTIIM
jgi:YesN/AraC family two-component response regulator